MKLAILISFSGQGGVERMVMNVLRQFARYQNLSLDLLLIRAQGPHLADIPASVNIIHLNARHTLTSIPEIYRYLRRQRPDAMLVAKDRAGRAALLAKWLANLVRSKVDTRIVIRLGTHLSTALAQRSAFNRWLRTAPMRFIYPMAYQVIAVAEGVRQDTLKLARLDADAVTVVRNPVITDSMLTSAQEPAPHSWLEEDVPVVLGIGRLSRQKDFPTLIKAFAKARDQRELRLIILGDGGDRDALQALVKSLGISDSVLMPGFDANPYRWLSPADLFVLSSRWEGSPNALTEALALGVPSVSTRCPSGPDETLQEGRYGRLLAMGDVDAMADAILETLAAPLSAETLKQAVSEYQDSISAAHYLRLLGIDAQLNDGHRQAVQS